MNDDPRRYRRAALAILFVSLVALAIAQMGSAEAEMNHDSAHYMELARSLLRGEGFTTQTHWALNIPIPEGARLAADTVIPRLDTYRSPLFPILIAAFSFVTPDLFVAAKWVSVVSGAFIPPLVFLLCHRRLGLSMGVSLIGAAITLANHHLVTSATLPLTETPYTAITTAVLFLVTAPKPRPLVAGALTGLAWLIRYQALIVVPCVAPALAGASGTRRARVTRLLLFGLGFVIVSAPWMIRNVGVAGDPLYTDLRYHMVSTYDRDHTTYHYFHGLEPAVPPLEYISAHPDRTAGHVVLGVKKIGRTFPQENAGNVGFALAALAGGVVWIVRRRRETWRTLSAFVLFGVANISLVTVSFVDDRHLTSLDPIVMILVAILIGALWDRFGARWVRVATLVLVAAGIGWEARVAYRALAPHRAQYLEFTEVTRDFLDARLRPGEAVMGEKPYYFSYSLDRRAVSLPWCSDSSFVALADSLEVRFAVVGGYNEFHFGRPYRGSFLDTGELPPRLERVHALEEPPVVVYEVLPPQVARSAP